MKPKPLIIPIFIPQEGCRRRCVYCDQPTISGVSQASWSPSSVRKYVLSYLARISYESSSRDREHGCATGSSQGLVPEAYLKSTPQGSETRGRPEGRPYPQSQQTIHKISGLRSNGRYPIQVAFYGGSFTLLPPAHQRFFLESVQEFLKQGQVHSLRLSTRPDAIEVNNLLFLQSMGVETIELGVQSLSDEVLSASARGHSSREVYEATLNLQQHGFEVGLQLMPGLPEDSEETFLQTVDKSIALNPGFVRLYPTVVLSRTPLERLYRRGRYRPLSLSEAVGWCKEAKKRFARAAIPIIRMGLQPTISLQQPGRIVAGPYHPAFGQLVNSAIWHERISPILKEASHRSPRLVIHAQSHHLADIRGHRNDNINRWLKKLNLTSLKTAASHQIGVGDFRVTAR